MQHSILRLQYFYQKPTTVVTVLLYTDFFCLKAVFLCYCFLNVPVLFSVHGWQFNFNVWFLILGGLLSFPSSFIYSGVEAYIILILSIPEFVTMSLMFVLKSCRKSLKHHRSRILCGFWFNQHCALNWKANSRRFEQQNERETSMYFIQLYWSEYISLCHIL